MLPTRTAGSVSANPWVRRLTSDHERLQQLVAQSSLVRITETRGSPPEQYILEMSCLGVERIRGSEPVFVDFHRVGIDLPAGYPTTKPRVLWLTTIYHPNIHETGQVCIGPWFAAKWLDELVFMLVEMAQYKNYDDDPTNVYNLDAANWARNNRGRLPVDRREIKDTGGLLSQISIGDSYSPVPENSVLDNIRILS
jgi:ubiquitin-protein ligase